MQFRAYEIRPKMAKKDPPQHDTEASIVSLLSFSRLFAVEKYYQFDCCVESFIWKHEKTRACRKKILPHGQQARHEPMYDRGLYLHFWTVQRVTSCVDRYPITIVMI